MSNLKKKDCPDGKMPIYISLSPNLIFVETFSKWMVHDLSDTVEVIKHVGIKFSIYIKDKSFNFEKST
jgi:hypothetical protein